MIGEKLAPVLKEIEDTLWEFEANRGVAPNYPDKALASSTKIFMSVMLDKMWKLQQKENMDMKVRGEMAQRLGEEIRKLIKTYTDIEIQDLYK